MYTVYTLINGYFVTSWCKVCTAVVKLIILNQRISGSQCSVDDLSQDWIHCSDLTYSCGVVKLTCNVHTFAVILENVTHSCHYKMFFVICVLKCCYPHLPCSVVLRLLMLLE